MASFVRFHDSVNEKSWFLKLTPDIRCLYFQLVIYSSKGRGCIETSDAWVLSRKLELPEDLIKSGIDILSKLGKIEIVGNKIVIPKYVEYNADPKNAERQANFRAKARGAFVDNVIREEIYNKSGGKCSYCGKSIKIYDMHVDHVTPISRGGKHEPSNCVCSCKDCNLEKSTRNASEFRRNGYDGASNRRNAPEPEPIPEPEPETETNRAREAGTGETFISGLIKDYNAFKPKSWIYCEAPNLYLRQQIEGQLIGNKVNADFDLSRILEIARRSEFLSGRVFGIDWLFDTGKGGRLNWKRVLNGEFKNIEKPDNRNNRKAGSGGGRAGHLDSDLSNAKF